MGPNTLVAPSVLLRKQARAAKTALVTFNGRRADAKGKPTLHKHLVNSG